MIRPGPENSIRRQLLILVTGALVLAGCATSSKLLSTLGNKFHYLVSMTGPTQSKNMLYADEQLMIQFRVDDPGIRFQIKNISADEMSIEWARATITVHGVSSPVRTISTFYDTTKTPPATLVIPSLGVVRDAVLPRASSYFDGRQWRVDDLLPTTDANTHTMRNTIYRLVGSNIELRMPVNVGTKPRWYLFTFSIDSVQQIPWSELHPVTWIPPHPPVKGVRPSPENQVTAVIIASSFLGFLKYMMTMKKVPVVE